MFGLGGSELFVVILLAIIFIGPKDLPRFASKLGRFYRQFKSAADDLKNTLEREIDLSEKPKNDKPKLNP